MELKLVATAAFGLEAVVKREIENLGYKVALSEDGRLTFIADELGVVRSNLWLRCADRVYIQLARFKAATFEQLFQGAKAIDWASILPEDAAFVVNGSSARSVLHSVPACQSIIEKAIIEKLKKTYKTEWFSKSGASYSVRFMIQKDECVILLDTSGRGLHKRGYRIMDVAAPMKETLAAALVSLSFFKDGRTLVDPFCGSGTIAIEAAQMAKNIAPGLNGGFDFIKWSPEYAAMWKEEKSAAFKAIKEDTSFKIIASDIDPRAVKAAKENAAEAGVDGCIEFRIADAKNLSAGEENGIIVCNPPYGQRIGEQKELDKIYKSLKFFLLDNPTWSLFLITADKSFEEKLGRNADRRRKLYNGRIEACYYQYHGKKKQ